MATAQIVFTTLTGEDDGGAHDVPFPTVIAADIFRLAYSGITLLIQIPQGRPDKRSPAVRQSFLPVSNSLNRYSMWWFGAELFHRTSNVSRAGISRSNRFHNSSFTPTTQTIRRCRVGLHALVCAQHG